MEKKKYILGLLVSILVIGIGTTFAYFATRTLLTGNGTNTQGTTVSLGDTTVNIEGLPDFSDTNIYPGHKTISKIKVIATGDKNVIYNLIWTGQNNLKTTLNYTVYKTTTEESPTITCEKKEEGNITKIFYVTCTETNFTNLGETVSIGEITPTTEETTFKLVKNEEIQATSSGAVVYYYVVLEYPNKEESQNIDMNGTFIGTTTIQALENKDLTGKELVLVNNTIDTSRASGEFKSTFEEDTAGKIFNAEDDDGTTYFFAGSNPNNWVKFGTNKEEQNLYWRIIRINGDGSIRLIYNGPTTDKEGSTTIIGESTFNENYNDNAYVGYMYGTPGSSSYSDTHTNTNSSTIKIYLDNWYEENLKVNYSQYLAINSGFCGDRTVDKSTGFEGNGLGTSQTGYAPWGRIWDNWNYKTTQIATYKCNQINDLYTVNTSTKGNKALENPIGLITSDEVIYAGGLAGIDNKSYWLNSNQYYWTISPYQSYSGYTSVIRILNTGAMYDNFVSSTLGVRPVINLRSDLNFVGSGTTSDPYRIAE